MNRRCHSTRNWLICSEQGRKLKTAIILTEKEFQEYLQEERETIDVLLGKGSRADKYMRLIVEHSAVHRWLIQESSLEGSLPWRMNKISAVRLPPIRHLQNLTTLLYRKLRRKAND
ncbi:MAG: hypothetical protein ACLTD4_31455 [Hungatella sp.]